MFLEPVRDGLAVRMTWPADDLQRAPSHSCHHCQMGAWRGEWPRATSLVCPERGGITDLLMLWGRGQALQGTGPQLLLLPPSRESATGARAGASIRPRGASFPTRASGRVGPTAQKGTRGCFLQLCCCCLECLGSALLSLHCPWVGNHIPCTLGRRKNRDKGGDLNGEKMKLWELFEVMCPALFLEAAALSPLCPLGFA